MALFNYANREITAKVVYYGPGVCGKTTSLQYIHERIAPVQRGRLLSLATETDRTIFFDLLPLKLGEIRGFKLRFQLYTVPGQVKYNKTRKLVLQGADAIVFVADSQVNRREKNLESFRNLQDNLKEQGKNIADLPLVFEYNKRDLDNVLSIDQLNQDLNPGNLLFFPAVATKGGGVMETLEAITKTALQDIEQRLSAGAKTESASQEEFSLTDDDLLDLTGADDASGLDSLSLSDDLDMLELDGDLDLMGNDDTLESKPIGYDNAIQVEELEIQSENIAQTGTLKESEFFDLKDIEEQALRELDQFIDGSVDDADFGTGGDLELDADALSFDAFESDAVGASIDDSSLSGFSFADSGPDDAGGGDDMDFSFSAATLDRDGDSEDDAAADVGGDLDFSFSASPLGEDETVQEQDDGGGLDFSFSASPLGEDDAAQSPGDDGGLDFSFSADIGGEEAGQDDDGGLDFSFDAAGDASITEADSVADDGLEFGASLEPDSLLDFTLGDEPKAQDTGQSEAFGDMEPLELSENELDFSDAAGEDLNLSFGESDAAEFDEDLPAFTLTDDDIDTADPSSSAVAAAADDELPEFTLNDELDATLQAPPAFDESSAISDIESLNLSDDDLDLSFGDDDDEDDTFSSLSGLNMAGEESGQPYDFRITDSVRFEMQHSEEISSVTPFEKQLNELSDEMFTAEEDASHDNFEPETAADSTDEEFQAVADESERQFVVAKYFYQQGELVRAKQATRSHIQAIMMYYLAVETALKSVALKYETCNPAVASLKIILDSIEEETGKTISGRKSVKDNITAMKDQIQMETGYPDQDACELAARICDRFLSTLAEEFLSLDMNTLAPILPEPVEN